MEEDSNATTTRFPSKRGHLQAEGHSQTTSGGFPTSRPAGQQARARHGQTLNTKALVWQASKIIPKPSPSKGEPPHQCIPVSDESYHKGTASPHQQLYKAL
jgi:hypothetical protein